MSKYELSPTAISITGGSPNLNSYTSLLSKPKLRQPYATSINGKEAFVGDTKDVNVNDLGSTRKKGPKTNLTRK